MIFLDYYLFTTRKKLFDFTPKCVGTCLFISRAVATGGVRGGDSPPQPGIFLGQKHVVGQKLSPTSLSFTLVDQILSCNHMYFHMKKCPTCYMCPTFENDCPTKEMCIKPRTSMTNLPDTVPNKSGPFIFMSRTL